MEAIVNLRTLSGQTGYDGNIYNVLSYEIYELFFEHLKKFHFEKIYLLSSDEEDGFLQKILKSYKEKLRLEPIISSKLTSASLVKRMIMNKKIKDHFIYFSQICLLDFNLQDFMDFHKYNDAMFTIALSTQPRSYTPNGFVYIDKDTKVQAFNYKYYQDEDYFAYVNTGIYAVSKKAINEIKNNNNGLDLMEDLLKHLVLNKKRTQVYLKPNYYNLLCTREEYYNAHMDFLSGHIDNSLIKQDMKPGEYIPKETYIGSNFHYQQPLMISRKAKVGNNVNISNSVIAGEVKIGHNVTIENSFIGDGVTIEDNAVVKNIYLYKQYVPSNTYMDGNN